MDFTARNRGQETTRQREVTDEPKTGVQQAIEKAGKGGIIPPKERRFGQPNGNPRNVRGVPKDAIELRRLIRKIGAEKLRLPARDGETAQEIRRLEALVKAMYSSRAPADRAAILKAGWPGVLKDEIDLTSGNKPLAGVIQIVEHKPDSRE